jgi:GTP-binding protein EngB required for normal cell division
MNSKAGQPLNSLNENQQRHLRVSCEYIDKLLSNIENILNTSASKAAFPQYIARISPAQRRTIEDYIARLRAQLVRVLDGQGMPRHKSSIPDVRAISVALTAIEIAVDDLRPENMRGYGDFPPEMALEFNGIVGEMEGLVSRLSRYVLQEEGEDLQSRLQRLEQTSDEFGLLQRTERTVAEHGLVEFRSLISGILDRMEDRSFEIAVFGRVSSGKSSLLNGILGTEVLPVGVTPITAVPTRVKYGETSSITVWFAERATQTLEVSRLAEFATEQQNPGNSKHVTRIVVQIPSERLRDGVTFVDTPGLGSLATKGAAETLAYLPRCDLGVVLIDSGTSLAPDDLRTIESLREAAIPIHLLVSKADLVAPADRERILAYVKEHVASECRIALPVHPVSALADHREMLDQWFREEILPLYGKAKELKSASLRRKIGALRDSVTAALQVCSRAGQSKEAPDGERLREIESKLRQATGKIQEVRPASEREIEKLPFLTAQILHEVAAQLFLDSSFLESKKSSASGLVLARISSMVQERTKVFHEYIISLAHHSAEELIETGKSLGLSNLPHEDEFDDFVHEVPVFALTGPNVDVSRPALRFVLGNKYAAKSVARQLNDQIGSELERALATYSNLLMNWVVSALKQLKLGFDVYADSYRAQAERLLAELQTVKGIQANKITNAGS